MGTWSVQFSSVAQFCLTLCDPLNYSTPGLPVHHQLRVYSNSCPFSWWCHPTISSSVIPFFPIFRVLSNESVLHMRWPKYWSFSFSIGLSNEYSGLISFRIDWLDLLAVQGTLKSFLQHHSFKNSILQCSAFFIVQLSHPNMTTGKTIALIAAAKSLQSCPTLCDPMNCSTPGLPVHHQANRWGNNRNCDRLYFLGLQNHCELWVQPQNLKRHLLIGRKAMTNLAYLKAEISFCWESWKLWFFQ